MAIVGSKPICSHISQLLLHFQIIQNNEACDEACNIYEACNGKACDDACDNNEACNGKAYDNHEASDNDEACNGKACENDEACDDNEACNNIEACDNEAQTKRPATKRLAMTTMSPAKSTTTTPSINRT